MKQARLGYSMIELVVVVAIMGALVMATSSFFSSNNSQPAAVKGTLNSLGGALADARTVARSTGRTVTLTTTGAQATMTMTFPTQGDVTPIPAGQVLTTWNRAAAGSQATKYAGVDTNSTWPLYTQTSPSPDPLVVDAVPAITALFTGGVAPASSAKLFTGSTSSAIVFDATGRPNQDFYVFIAGMRNGQSYPSAPVGLVLVTRANGIHTFYKPNAQDATVPWQRL
jgi:prepilin-type N-terminal cleavage/methylation domain-containing protein